MKLRHLLLGAAAIGATACSSDSPSPADPSLASAAPAASAIAGQYIVVFKNDVADAPGLARRLVAEQGGTMRFSYAHALKGFSARLSDAAVERLRKNPNVAYVEQNQQFTINTDQSGATWGIDRIDQRKLPLNSTYSYSTTASNVTAYIIDTGLLPTHNEFGGRASIGYDAVGDGQNGIDCNGHGTHVAGTVGGTTYGVAKSVKLVGVRVLNCGGSGSTDGVIAGIDWVTANHASPAVANMSLGGGTSQSLDDAVTRSIASGVTYAIAAGNGNLLGRQVDACTQSPARTPNAITVGATDISDKEATFSNYGKCVDILAPGVNVTSSWIGNNSATNTISGTSMATPHVAGVAALWLADHPTDTPAQVTTALTSNATSGTIALNAKSSSAGTPNLLVYSVFGAAPPPPPPGNQPPTSSFTYSCTTLNCNFTDKSTDSDGTVVSWSWNFGDGTTSTAQNPSHSFARRGSYTVKLTVKDNAGASASSQQTVTVRPR